MYQGLGRLFQTFEGRVLGEFLPGDLVFPRWMWFCRCQQGAQQAAPVSFPLDMSLGRVTSQQGQEPWDGLQVGRPQNELSPGIAQKVSPKLLLLRHTPGTSLVTMLWDHRGPPQGGQPSGGKVCTGYLLNRGKGHKEETWGKNLCSTFKAIVFLHVGNSFATFSFGFFW